MAFDAMNAIFGDFAQLLESRLRDRVLTTEDSVRYTLFAAMLHHNIQPEFSDNGISPSRDTKSTNRYMDFQAF